jgi:hypothetical protein
MRLNDVACKENLLDNEYVFIWMHALFKMPETNK